MTLTQLKDYLSTTHHLTFQLPQGGYVPAHFHITEVGLSTKHFIDCGGTIRTESAVNFQIWTSVDVDHRLSAEKLLKIIQLAEQQFPIENLNVEVEYQQDTIGKYGLELGEQGLQLTSTHTNCLAQDQCGIPEAKKKLELASIQTSESSCCTPGGGCC